LLQQRVGSEMAPQRTIMFSPRTLLGRTMSKAQTLERLSLTECGISNDEVNSKETDYFSALALGLGSRGLPGRRSESPCPLSGIFARGLGA
jgi:hypothetical protein